MEALLAFAGMVVIALTIRFLIWWFAGRGRHWRRDEEAARRFWDKVYSDDPLPDPGAGTEDEPQERS